MNFTGYQGWVMPGIFLREREKKSMRESNRHYN